MSRFRFAKAPPVIRVDSEGAFTSHGFECGAQLEALKFKSASEAQWQTGIVEPHIRLLRNQMSVMEDEVPDASIDELVENCVAAKVRRKTIDG